MKNNRIKTTRRQGFTLVEIMIVVAIIGMLASIAIPNFVKARQRAAMTSCITNLQQIDGAIQEWAMEERKDPGQAVQYADIRGYLRNEVVCPAGGTSFEDSYRLTTVEAPPACLRVPAGPHAHKVAVTVMGDP
jgi:prepilin-type N-terminal cleavage/methylation domain-containing protein